MKAQQRGRVILLATLALIVIVGAVCLNVETAPANWKTLAKAYGHLTYWTIGVVILSTELSCGTHGLHEIRLSTCAV